MRRWAAFLAMALILTAPAAAGADVIVIRADEWCPYNCAPDSDRPGYMIEIARAVFEKQGHAIDYDVTNWSRAIMLAEKGKIDAIVGAVRAEAPNLIFPDIETGYSINGFFVRKGHGWRFDGMDSLKAVRMGVIQDYGYGKLDPYIEAGRETDRILVTAGENALELNIRMLLKGRIDAVNEDIAVFRNTAREMGVTDQIDFAGDDGESGEANAVHIAFSPASPASAERARLLGEGMRNLRAGGELARILERYGLSDWR